MAELHPAESYMSDGKGGVIYLIDGKLVKHFTAAEFTDLLDEFGEETDEDKNGDGQQS